METSVEDRRSDLPQNIQPQPVVSPSPKRSQPNQFGLMREYIGRPIVDLEDVDTRADLMDDSAGRAGSALLRTPMSSFLFGKWYWGSREKTVEDRKALLGTLFHEDFKLDDIRDVNWRSMDEQLAGKHAAEQPWDTRDG